MNQTHFEVARCFCNKPVEQSEGTEIIFNIYAFKSNEFFKFQSVL